MTKISILVAAILFCMPGASAQQRNIDTQRSTMTIRVGKTGLLSGLAHEHEIRAAISGGTADTGARPAVTVYIDARSLRVLDPAASESDRADVQNTMLGNEVLDSEHYPRIAFTSNDAHSEGDGRWTLRGNLTLRGRSRPVAVSVILKDGDYRGHAVVKLTDFGIKPPGKPGLRAKDEVAIDFDAYLAP